VYNITVGYEQGSSPIFRLFSSSKPITSALTLMLMDEGLLDIDDPLYKFLPGFEKVGVSNGCGGGGWGGGGGGGGGIKFARNRRNLKPLLFLLVNRFFCLLLFFFLLLLLILHSFSSSSSYHYYSNYL